MLRFFTRRQRPTVSAAEAISKGRLVLGIGWVDSLGYPVLWKEQSF